MFVLRKAEEGKSNAVFVQRPLAERVADYEDEFFAQAFPLLFPYGFSGLPSDPALQKAKEEIQVNKNDLKRTRTHVIKKMLQLSNPCCHAPFVNLIFHNALLKATIFEKTKMYCNTKMNDFQRYGEMFGTLTPDGLLSAIENFRKNTANRFSTTEEAFFLRSIIAICKKMPQTNEAANEAREIYFSYHLKFGLPAIFLTVTPDDNRNYRIVLYSLERKEYAFSETKETDFTDNDVIKEIKIRSDFRQKFPGLCAEEYRRIMDAVITHFFGWDLEKGSAKETIGFFGKPLAWLLATEEQGRKSLHGHVLLFIKDWKRVLNVLHRGSDESKNHFWDILTFAPAERRAKSFFRNACTCHMFQEFKPGSGKLCNKCTLFEHECEGRRSERVKKSMRYTPTSVPSQEF